MDFYLSDLDFTLLRSDQSLGDLTREVWNEAVGRGMKLSIATARSLTGAKKLLQGLHLAEPMILLDGVMIARHDGRILHLAAIERDLGDAIIEEMARAFGQYPLLVGLDAGGLERFVYPKRRTACHEKLLKTFHNDRRLIDAEPFRAMDRNLKLVYLGDDWTTHAMENLLNASFGETIETKRSEDPYIDCWFLTVLDARGDKAHALAKLEEMEAVDRARTTVFGDSFNDLGLFKMAGRKIAVANAVEAIKRAADIVLPYSNDDEGVARFLAKELDDE